MMDSDLTVVGIDVGAMEKGFHAVALRNGAFQGLYATSSVGEMAGWCGEALGANVVAVDAPCCWRPEGGVRVAERELRAQGIQCFVTPTRAEAVANRSSFYTWMLNGEALYAALNSMYPLCTEWPSDKERYCFETFPHAITWHLRGGKAEARLKGVQRRELLRQAGIDLPESAVIDFVDAALCALTAHHAVKGVPTRAYGDRETGYIVVPLCGFENKLL